MLRGLFLTALFAVPISCLANDIGKIENSAGDAVVLRENKAVAATAGTILRLNDVLLTEAGALLRVGLNDGSALMIGEGSEVRVAFFDADQQQVLVEMLHGHLRAEVAPRTMPKGHFYVRTPAANVIALGTVVAVDSPITETNAASLTGVVSQQKVNNLPTSRRNPMDLVNLAPGVGNRIKPQNQSSNTNQPPQPNNLFDIPYGNLGASYLGSYQNVNTTWVTALDHSVVTTNSNPAITGMTFLLPGQTAKLTRDSDNGADLGGPIVKDKLWFWGGYGKSDIPAISQNSSAGLGDFGVNGQPCQPGFVVNGVAAAGTTPSFHYKILGGGISTGENALHVTISNDGSCPLYFMVPLGTVMHPKGFVGRVISGFLLGGVPNLKDFQILGQYGRFVRVVPAGALGAGPAAPAGGEVTVPLRSYCLELHKLAPAPQTEYRFADENEQKKLGVYGPLMQHVVEMWFKGQFDQAKGHSLDGIIQWSLWTKIEGLDEKKFMETFLGLARKNYEAKKEKFDKEAEKKVDASGHDLWTMVQAVLK